MVSAGGERCMPGSLGGLGGTAAGKTTDCLAEGGGRQQDLATAQSCQPTAPGAACRLVRQLPASRQGGCPYMGCSTEAHGHSCRLLEKQTAPGGCLGSAKRAHGWAGMCLMHHVRHQWELGMPGGGERPAMARLDARMGIADLVDPHEGMPQNPIEAAHAYRAASTTTCRAGHPRTLAVLLASGRGSALCRHSPGRAHDSQRPRRGKTG